MWSREEPEQKRDTQTATDLGSGSNLGPWSYARLHSNIHIILFRRNNQGSQNTVQLHQGPKTMYTLFTFKIQ